MADILRAHLKTDSLISLDFDVQERLFIVTLIEGSMSYEKHRELEKSRIENILNLLDKELEEQFHQSGGPFKVYNGLKDAIRRLKDGL